MNEARHQAYLNLIESLLNCPNGEENQILEANSELVDAGLVQLVQLYAENQRDEGNENAANFLTNLASQLAEFLESPSANSQLKFLQQLLQATSDGNGDVIYSLLRENINLVNDDLAVLLRNWAAETLSNLDNQDIRSSLGLVIGNFSTVPQQFNLGNNTINLEIAIAGYEVALMFFTRQEDSEDWARTQNNLGNAYSQRIRGEKADNIERAIYFYHASLEIYTREAYPEDWARIRNNLGNAYTDRIRSEKADNIETAIAFYQSALSVYTRNNYPEKWANTQNSLAAAYSQRIRGEKADNIEKAIAFYAEALSISINREFPQDWARTQNGLATFYSERIRGEKAENIEKAIEFYQSALSVLTREAYPQDWARTQNNLGNAYSKRIRGEKSDNIEMAIEFYQSALSVLTRDAFPEDWATTQNNLGNAYSDRIRGERADNIEMAIQCFQAALEIRTHDAFPENWATTQNNLGNAYSHRMSGEKADNIEMAIECFQSALLVLTLEAYPEDWATTQNNLGNAYTDRIKGEMSNNIEMAFQCFQAAMETKLIQGVNSQRDRESEKAYTHLADAINLLEICRNKISCEKEKQKFTEEWNKLYQAMVELCLETENNTAALEYVERSKTRNLVELFHNTRSLPHQVQRQPITFAEIRHLLTENEAIVEWYITPTGFKTFIVTRDSMKPDVWQSSYADLEELEKFQHEYINDIKDEKKYDNWKNQLEARLEKLAQILHIDEIISRLPENCQKLILVPFRYLHLFPLHALLSKRQKPKSKSVETGCLLELFPGGVRYTPSCQLLQLYQRLNPTSEDVSPTRFFAIQNPTEDLDFTDIEVEAIAKSFNPAEILSRQQASKTALQQQFASLQNVDIAHFSCHGFFDFINPQKSSLILAGAKIATDGVPSEEKSYIRSRRGETFDIAECLTLEEIFDLQLSKCSLVVLSACETGLTDIKNTTDEYIGLPSGFFYAGATSILSTLWAVNDLSTAILTIKFYELFRGENRPAVAVALRESQLWLRSLNVKGLLEWVEASQLLSREHKTTIQDSFAYGYEDDYQPYEAPHFWAAFCAVGQ